MLSDKPSESGPALEVDNVVLTLFLRQPSSCLFTSQSYCDVEGAKQEPYLLTSRILGLVLKGDNGRVQLKGVSKGVIYTAVQCILEDWVHSN